MAEFKEEIAFAMAKLLDGKMEKEQILELIEVPPSQEMGDYSFPCFKLAAVLKKSPNAIASELASTIQLPPNVKEAKPLNAYLNFYLKKEKLAEKVLKKILSEKENYGILKGKKSKIMVEYSSPNTNKPLHLGHLRNDSTGMAISNILSANGNEVIKANLVNDRGIHICKTMLAFQKWAKNSSPEKEKIKPDHFVGNLYVLFSKEAEKNPELENEVQEFLKKWEAGDRQTIALWKKMNKWVIKGFKETYKNFGSKFDVFFLESDYYNKAKPLIEEGLKKGVFLKNEDGAIIAKLEPHGLPDKTVMRADGTSIYLTNDLALTLHKFEKFKLDESIWVVASEQNLYFQQLFKIFELFGMQLAKKCRHLSYGMVYLPSGKMKSREGTVIDADNLISEMIELAKKEILQREPKIPKKEMDSRAKKIGLAAIKFYLLKVDCAKDIYFKPEESISFEGETGPYIQYTFARTKSILKKAKKQAMAKKFDLLESDVENKLLSLLGEFPNIVEKCRNSLSLHVLCQYLIEVSETFNSFYHFQPVLKSEKKTMEQRLCLVEAVSIVLKNGLNLLNIEALERM